MTTAHRKLAKLNGAVAASKPGKVRLRESVNGHRNRFNGIKSQEEITEKEEAFEQKPDQTDIRL
ncbi:MAG: hypothetical protein VYD77_00355 [Actinomycetota bacterium]|nr:hypothetical protein [Actinomycetota bacterium]